MVRKNHAFAEDGAALGHNKPDEAILRKGVEKIAKWKNDQRLIERKIKDELNYLKDNGFLKTAVRNTVKDLTMTEEQYQAKMEVHAATERYTELCADLPIFAHAKQKAKEIDDEEDAA